MNNDMCRYISMTSFELRYRYKTTSNKLMFEAVAGTILSCDHFLLTSQYAVLYPFSIQHLDIPCGIKIYSFLLSYVAESVKLTELRISESRFSNSSYLRYK